MLVLSRQRDEAIMIGDEIEITVVDIRGDKVRLGIAAPRSVQVHRKEVFDAIRRENTAASRIHIADLQVADRSLRRLGSPSNPMRSQAV
ncbi:MAG: carbon storage regulator CsrA [Phycisphaerales bacterium]|nr:carbon storage regulator CsrA [Phycisphaerales bacterium]